MSRCFWIYTSDDRLLDFGDFVGLGILMQPGWELYRRYGIIPYVRAASDKPAFIISREAAVELQQDMTDNNTLFTDFMDENKCSLLAVEVEV